jgi:hypothetical protein
MISAISARRFRSWAISPDIALLLLQQQQRPVRFVGLSPPASTLRVDFSDSLDLVGSIGPFPERVAESNRYLE